MSWLERLVLRLPRSWVQRIDNWVNKPPPPRCPWKSGYGRQCEYKLGHGGQCLTIGPAKRYRWYWGINYDMVEGVPFRKVATRQASQAYDEAPGLGQYERS